VAERLKAADSKSAEGIKPSAGSNPVLSAIFLSLYCLFWLDFCLKVPIIMAGYEVSLYALFFELMTSTF
jgi:hypothetical protein